MKNLRKRIPRRDFIKTTAVATAGLIFVKPQSVYGTQANSALALGIIGCGGRGNYLGREFVNNTNSRIVALADLFDDRLAEAKANFDKLADEKGHPKINASQIFKGGRAYEKLLDSKVDAVIIASPPYFHPEHFEAAVARGKHVYLEKPVATDVYGCKRVMRAGERANGKISVDVGFQTRYSEAFRQMVRRIHDGAIGEIVCAEAYYFARDLPRKAKPGMSELEARIRNWVFDRVLSGDILVEQNVHVIDVCNWVLRSHPIRAIGSGGRKARTDVGDVWDHYNVIFFYPNDVQVSFSSTQFLKGWGNVCERFFGTKGVSESCYRGGARILGDEPWDSGVDSTLEGSVAEKVKAFVDSIVSGNYHNEAKQGAESTLSAILGRTAAYRGKEMSWDKLIRSNERWDARLNLDALQPEIASR